MSVQKILFAIPAEKQDRSRLVERRKGKVLRLPRAFPKRNGLPRLWGKFLATIAKVNKTE